MLDLGCEVGETETDPATELLVLGGAETEETSTDPDPVFSHAVEPVSPGEEPPASPEVVFTDYAPKPGKRYVYSSKGWER